MFFTAMMEERLNKRIEDLERFEKAVCQIVDGYFHRNEQHDGKYYMDNAIDRFLLFVESVDKRLCEQEKEIKKLKEKVEQNGN